MAVHIADKLEPLVKQTTELEARIRVSEENIGAKQCVLEQQQEKLASRLVISELAVAAKAGSRKAYTSLSQLYASNPTTIIP